ncbi:TetR/AcrR family transcriptional regulator [Antrihabitans sp. YC2-6]|uniref:TetR/AcrR family transcriptional regulator n=1 Tax=Antrihabitans sp. YC2-6 TaxID=2799498 RepID=UPI0018F75897|nr:TetR/AcrR family transcriptional regulator [Antrihabitans sp. YC2-6]MBJ8343080.1 TetR family transcriptional regulator [Antrihabitans sp. YC2-6]
MIGNAMPRIPYADAARNLLRESVLTAVDELVQAKGWAATSVATVARVAGVSRQTVYKEFGSRQSIAEAYILRRLDSILDEIDANIRSSDDLEAGLHTAISLFFDIVDEPLVQTVLSGGSTPEELTGIIKVTNERATTRLASMFQAVRPGIPDSDAIVFGDAIARICAAHAFAPTLPREEATNRVVRLALVVLAAN